MVRDNSRYANIEQATFLTPEGREVAYFRRRFVPDTSTGVILAEHRVEEDDRLDLIAAKRLGDPELFWQICDANRALDPDELTAPDRRGRTLIIPVPQGR